MTAASPKSSVPKLSLVQRGVWVMLGSVGGFTINTLLLKYLGTYREVPSLLPLLFRAGVGIAMVLFLIRGARPTRIRPVFREGRLIARGLTGLLGTAAYYWTVPAMGPGKATLFCNTYVVFAAIIAALWLHEPLSWARSAWLAVALAGIILLSGAWWNGMAGVFGVAEAVALGGAVLAAVSVVLIRQLAGVHSGGTIYLAQCVWILLPILPWTVPCLPGLPLRDVAVLLLAAVAAGFGQLAMNEGYRCLSVATGASLQMLWPVATALGGLAWFGEWFSWPQILGAAMILTATWCIAVRKK